MKEYNKPTQS